MIQSPVLVIGCPRSGTTLLFSVLSEVPSLWSIGYESKEIVERYHSPSTRGWESGALDATDLTRKSRQYMLRAFEQSAAPGTFWQQVSGLRRAVTRNPLYRRIKKRGQTGTLGAGVSSALPQQGLNLIRSYVRLRGSLTRRSSRRPIRLVEKTPENCLRLPFLLELFPDARVLYLVRDGRSNVHSLLEGWRQPHLFPGYRVPEKLSIPGYSRDRWAFTLIPGWRDLKTASLEEISAWQWVRCNEAVLAHRAASSGRVPYLTLRYEELVSTPGKALAEVAAFLGLDFDRDLGHFAEHLPQINAVSTPERDKWRRQNPELIGNVMPILSPMMHELGYDDVSS